MRLHPGGACCTQHPARTSLSTTLVPGSARSPSASPKPWPAPVLPQLARSSPLPLAAASPGTREAAAGTRPSTAEPTETSQGATSKFAGPVAAARPSARSPPCARSPRLSLPQDAQRLARREYSPGASRPGGCRRTSAPAGILTPPVAAAPGPRSHSPARAGAAILALTPAPRPRFRGRGDPVRRLRQQ